MNSPEDDACTEIGPGIYLTPSLLLVIATTALSVSCDGVEIFISLAASSNSFFLEVSLLAILISLFAGLDRLFHRYSTHRYSRRVEYLWLFVNIDNRVNKVDYYIYRGVYVVKIFISGKYLAAVFHISCTLAYKICKKLYVSCTILSELQDEVSWKSHTINWGAEKVPFLQCIKDLETFPWDTLRTVNCFTYFVLCK